MDNKKIIAINLGSGTHIAPNWINFDNSPSAKLSKFPVVKWLLWKLRILSDFHYNIPWPKDIVIRELSKPLPFSDNSVDFIYSSHFIEHLSFNDAQILLNEIYRVLKPQGVVRIVLPDIKWHINKYLEQSTNSLTEATACDTLIDELLMVKKTRDPHLWMYDAPSIMNKLQEKGFSNVYSCKFKEGKCIDIDILDNRPESSLWVEAQKSQSV